QRWGGKRWWQLDTRDRIEAEARWRHRRDQGALRALSLHRRPVAAAAEPVVDGKQRHPARSAQQPRGNGLRHRGVSREKPSGLAGLRNRRRREGPAANSNPRERMRSATRRGHHLLSPADQERRPRALPPSHGYHARYRNLRDRLPGHQLRYGARHRSVLQKIVSTSTSQFTRLWTARAERWPRIR